MRTDTYRVDQASFRVLPASPDAVTGSRAGGNGNGRGEATPLPDQAGADQTGAELGAGQACGPPYTPAKNPPGANSSSTHSSRRPVSAARSRTV